MIELKANLWQIPCDVRVISVNGSTNRFGHAVLGRGCALEAKQRYPELPKQLGALLGGPERNHVYYFEPFGLVTFPVKHRWMECADLALITQSTHELVAMATAQAWEHVALIRAGCGNGQLSWSLVKPVLEPLLDDRFLVCSFMYEG